MISALEMKNTIKDVYHSGYAPFFEHLLKKPRVRQEIFGHDNETISDSLMEAYYCATNIKNNISMYPQFISVCVDSCDINDDLRISTQHHNSKTNKHKLIQDGFIDYVVEYTPRMFGMKGFIENAVYCLMKAYCADEGEQDINHLVNCYALVRYYCNDFYVFSRESSEVHYTSQPIKESKEMASLDNLIRDRFNPKLEFSEEDLDKSIYTNPLNLYRAWENEYELTEADFLYIKTFNIVIYFSANIKEFNLFRKSYLFYDNEKNGFVHLTQDSSGGSPNRTQIDSKIYSNVDEINELISMAKKYEFWEFSLTQKNYIPSDY